MKKWLYSLLGIAIVWLIFPGLIEFIGTVFFFLIFLVILGVVVYWRFSSSVSAREGKELVSKWRFVTDKNGKVDTEFYSEYEDIKYDDTADWDDDPHLRGNYDEEDEY